MFKVESMSMNLITYLITNFLLFVSIFHMSLVSNLSAANEPCYGDERTNCYG